MKKILSVIIAALMLLSLCACTVEKTDINPGSSYQPEGERVVNEYVFKTGGVTIAMNADSADFIESLGEPEKYFEEPSCASDDLDKVYLYRSFQLCAYPKDDSYYVYSVTLLDDTVSTSEGVCIGDSLDKVMKTYGDSPEIEGVTYTYTSGKSQLKFTVEDGIVTAILYLAVI